MKDEITELMDKSIRVNNNIVKTLKALNMHLNKVNYCPSEEEIFFCELLKAHECKNLYCEYGVIYNNFENDGVIDFDLIERMNVDIIEGTITFYSAEECIYIVDLKNERISCHEGAL